jgi:hypothetical protein
LPQGNFVELEPTGARYRVVAAGYVSPNFRVATLSSLQLTAPPLGAAPGTFTLTYKGYTPPARPGLLIVQALPEVKDSSVVPVVNFVAFSQSEFTLRLWDARAQKPIIDAFALMVEVRELILG